MNLKLLGKRSLLTCLKHMTDAASNFGSSNTAAQSYVGGSWGINWGAVCFALPFLTADFEPAVTDADEDDRLVSCTEEPVESSRSASKVLSCSLSLKVLGAGDDDFYRSVNILVEFDTRHNDIHSLHLHLPQSSQALQSFFVLPSHNLHCSNCAALCRMRV